MTMAIVKEWARMHNLTIEEAVNQIEYLMIHGQKEKEPFAEGSRKNNSDQF